MAKRVFLLDGHSIVYRSYYAFIRNPLKNSKGLNTSAVFGFVNTLKRLFTKFKPEFIACAFDTGEETFRHKEYKEYKIERPESPKDLEWQTPVIKKLCSAYGIKVFEMPGYEADDVIASLALRLKDKSFEVYIVSSDKDLLQLVSDKIFMYDPYKDLLYDPERVKERYGVSPEKVSDILALAGDSIDNIPGVKGIGEKRAQEIILTYGSLEEALKKDERLKGHEDEVLLSKKLVALKTDLFPEISEEDLRLEERDEATIREIFTDLEFFNLLKEFGETAPEEKVIVQEGLPEIGKEMAFFLFEDYFYLTPDGRKVFKVSKNRGEDLLKKGEVLKIFYDLKSLLHKGIEVKPPVFDIKIGYYLIEPTRKRYELTDLILIRKKRLVERLRPEEAVLYLFSLYQDLAPEISARGLDYLFSEIEMPLIFCLYDMEKRGIKIDLPYFEQLAKEAEGEMERIEKGIFADAGIRFNVNSPSQLATILFEKLKLPPKKMGKRLPSTDSSVLLELLGKHPIIEKLLKYRELSKMRNTYLLPIPDLLNKETGRLHTSFHQWGTATGRLSSSDPNLQNIPIRGEWGKRIRKGFVAEDGFLFISADYSQIELRILAHFAQEENLIAAFGRGEDIHTATAKAIFKKEEIDENLRRMAKAVNYGIIYGMSEFGLAEGMKISREEAKRFMEEYFNLYPKIKDWREKVIRETKERGYTRTLFGRMRPISEIFSNNKTEQELGQRLAINSTVQGSAADIIKKAMVEIYEELKGRRFRGGILVQVHDELLFEIEEERIEEAKEIIKEKMEGVVKLNCPLAVNIGIGKNWDCHP
ncbi:MAG: DNA polymerase I [candidate division WOR-3 bacterium]